MNLFIGLYRVFKSAWQNFWRNIWLSLATLMVMVITLFMASFLYFANVFGGELLRALERKVDLSVTFKDDLEFEQVMAVARQVEAREDVESVRVISSEEALDIFRRNNANKPAIEESLKILGENPLPPSMFILASNPEFYEKIAADLQSEAYAPYVAEVNLEQSRSVIERLLKITTTVRNVGFFVTLLFALLVVLIMFSTVRLAIYSFREEIDIMRLVGASNWYIRGPFLMEAVLLTVVAVIISTTILYVVTGAASGPLQRYFFDPTTEPFDLHTYATAHWVRVVGLQLISGTILAIFSTMMAMRRYLKR